MNKQSSTKIHQETFNDPFLGDNKREYVDALNCINGELKKVLRNAYQISAKTKSPINGTTIAEAIVQNKSLVALFARLAIPPHTVVEKLQHIRSLNQFTTINNITDLLPASYKVGFELGADEIGLNELLIVLTEHDMAVKEVFLDSGIDSEMIRNVSAWIYYDKKLVEKYRLLKWRSLVHPKHHLDRAMTAMETPLLNQVGSDMTEQAANNYFLPAVERADVLQPVYELIVNRESAVIVGQPGVGKRRFLEMLAENIVSRNTPAELQDKRLMNISIGQLISCADTSVIAKRIQRLFYEAMSAGNAILVFEDIHGLAGIQAGSGESIDVASIVADAIQRSGILVLATSSLDEYRSALAGSTLGETLKKVEMPEPDKQTAIKIVETRAHLAESKHQVFFTYASIERLVDIAIRYIHDRYLPRKATEHLDRIALEIKDKKGEHNLIGANDVNAYMEGQLHLPLQQSEGGEADLLLHLEDALKKDIVGQQNAIDAVASALRRTRAGVGDDARPIAVLLFMGPTGVGKTALAKALAKHYFKDSKNMLRLDMSEYQGDEGVTKLVGGRGQQSSLVSQLREKPFQVVLLDEFEKADLEVRNLFLQVFDDARLSDGAGRTADFTNTIIIATSNAGAELIQQAAQENLSDEELDKLITEEVLGKNFSPELLNRFDETVIFHPLTSENVNDITRLIIKEIESRLHGKGIGLKVSNSAILELSKLGFDRRFGARPLRRAVQQKLEEPLAQTILKGEANRRDTIVVNSLDNITIQHGKIL